MSSNRDNRDRAIKMRDMVAERMKPAQIAEAQSNENAVRHPGAERHMGIAECVGRNKRSALRRPTDIEPIESGFKMAQ